MSDATKRNQLAQAALCRVACCLGKSQGQRQFYDITLVQAATLACGVGRELIPWVFAGLIRRPEFEAYYSLREVPGTYEQLRSDLSSVPFTTPNDLEQSGDSADEYASLLNWLEVLAEAADDIGGV